MTGCTSILFFKLESILQFRPIVKKLQDAIEDPSIESLNALFLEDEMSYMPNLSNGISFLMSGGASGVASYVTTLLSRAATSVFNTLEDIYKIKDYEAIGNINRLKSKFETSLIKFNGREYKEFFEPYNNPRMANVFDAFLPTNGKIHVVKLTAIGNKAKIQLIHQVKPNVWWQQGAYTELNYQDASKIKKLKLTELKSTGQMYCIVQYGISVFFFPLGTKKFEPTYQNELIGNGGIGFIDSRDDYLDIYCNSWDRVKKFTLTEGDDPYRPNIKITDYKLPEGMDSKNLKYAKSHSGEVFGIGTDRNNYCIRFDQTQIAGLGTLSIPNLPRIEFFSDFILNDSGEMYAAGVVNNQRVFLHLSDNGRSLTQYIQGRVEFRQVNSVNIFMRNNGDLLYIVNRAGGAPVIYHGDKKIEDFNEKFGLSVSEYYHTAISHNQDGRMECFLFDEFNRGYHFYVKERYEGILDAKGRVSSGKSLRMSTVRLHDGELLYVNEVNRYHSEDTGYISPKGEGLPGFNSVDGAYASSAFPGVIEPMTKGDNIYIDGGVKENMPLDMALKFNPDRVFVIPLNPYLSVLPKLKKSRRNEFGLLDIANRSFELLYDELEQNDLNKASDVKNNVTVVRPELPVGETFGFEFSGTESSMAYGYMRAFDTYHTVGEGNSGTKNGFAMLAYRARTTQSNAIYYNWKMAASLEVAYLRGLQALQEVKAPKFLDREAERKWKMMWSVVELPKLKKESSNFERYVRYVDKRIGELEALASRLERSRKKERFSDLPLLGDSLAFFDKIDDVANFLTGQSAAIEATRFFFRTHKSCVYAIYTIREHKRRLKALLKLRSAMGPEALPDWINMNPVGWERHLESDKNHDLDLPFGKIRSKFLNTNSPFDKIENNFMNIPSSSIDRPLEVDIQKELGDYFLSNRKAG